LFFLGKLNKCNNAISGVAL